MEKGDDYSALLTLTDGTGTAIDITGWTVTFTIKNNYNDSDSDAIYQQIITTHTSPTQGKTTISIPDATSETFDTKTYLYDIQTVSDATVVKTILKGDFKVAWDVTRTK